MTEPTVEPGVSSARRSRRPAPKTVPEGPSEHPLARLQRLAGNRAVTRLVAPTPRPMAQPTPTPTPVVQRQKQSVVHVPWTGDPLSMANEMRNLIANDEIDRAVKSLSMLWVRGLVDTLRMLKIEPVAYRKVTSAPEFTNDARLAASLDVVEGRPVRATALYPDQATELMAMADVPDWPKIIGPDAPPLVLHPDLDRPDIVRRDPEYLNALYDAIRRNRAMTGHYLLESVGKGYKYVGASHKGDQPSDLDKGGEKRQAVNAAIWKELGVGEGTQASVNTYDSAKFSFGPGFAARGGLDLVMKNLAKSGAEVLGRLRNAGVIFTGSTWHVVDPDARTVRSGGAALDILSKDRGLISAFLDTAVDEKTRREWMEAEWQALTSRGGAADVPDQVVETWPVELIVFVAHCVHWRPEPGWKRWGKPTPPSVFQVVRDIAPQVPRRDEDERILTRPSARTLLGFSNGLLVKALREQSKRGGIAANLPDEWKTGFAGAIALPESDDTPRYHIIEAGE